MRKLLLVLTVITVCGVVNSFAQTRYLDETFASVDVQSNIVYGANVTVITGAPALDTLKMDVYTPSGDAATNRPLILYIHTGSFLPNPLNGQCTGDKSDSAVVEMCSRFARKGYVVAAINYRLGWNPVGDQDTRTGTLLNAVYRALQDAKSCVRFFRKSVATAGNPFGIDENKIVIGGQGSGGYVSLAYATVDKYSEITLFKFLNLTTGNPYVDTTLSGDWDGYGGTGLNQPALNNPGYSNDVNMIFNMGGAIGDSIWLEAGDVPMVCAHVVNDPFAPYTYGPVIVPTTQQFVVNVSGSYDIIRRALYLGNNQVFVNAGFNDVFTNTANLINDGQEGLYPLLRPDPPGPLTGEAGPWEWWDTTCTQHAQSLASNPDMSKTKAMAYIDTMQGYITPRMFYALGLNVGVDEMDLLQSTVKIYPNPAADRFTVSVSNTPAMLNSVRLYDFSGRVIRELGRSASGNIEVLREGLSAGVYYVRASFDKGDVVRKVIFQ